MSEVIEIENNYHFQMYNRYPVVLEKGLGSKVWDENGKEYIDALSGIAVNALGYSHPDILEIMNEQASKLIHTSNFFYTKANSDLAKNLCELSGMDRAFFVNSGAEATEGAMKIARYYNYKKGKPESEIISLENSFHGRTIATIGIGQKKYQEGFGPLPGATKKAIINDIDSLIRAINQRTGAVIIETVQGEGGVTVANGDYLKEVQKICNDRGILLIMDEVQSGNSRTGELYAYQNYGIEPDIMCTAKGLAAGFPIGAVAAKEEVASILERGKHGSTFGGNPLACAIANKTLEIIANRDFLNQVKAKGKYFLSKLENLLKDNSKVKEIRGIGLMIGVELNEESRPIALKMLENGVIVSATAGTVIRIVPPLVINYDEIDKVIEVLVNCLD